VGSFRAVDRSVPGPAPARTALPPRQVSANP
jgi:hypothetical protein